MSVCEKCWDDAHLIALDIGKSQTECYHELLEERKDNVCTPFEQSGGRNDCDTCHGIGSVDFFTPECETIEIRCPDCNTKKASGTITGRIK